MVSPFFFPVDAKTFNFVRQYIFSPTHSPHFILQACVIFGAVTIFGIVSWYFTPEEKWLRREQVLHVLHAADQPEIARGN